MLMGSERCKKTVQIASLMPEIPEGIRKDKRL